MPRYQAAIAAALLAEVAFVAMMAVVRALRGLNAWFVVKVPAVVLAGPAMVEPDGSVAFDVGAGVLAHIAFSVIVGWLLYAFLLPKLGTSAVARGLATGAVLYVFGFWILPALLPIWLGPFALPPFVHVAQAIAHALYGIALGMAYERLAR